MPLYSITSYMVDSAHDYFVKYQADIYEPDSDPVTFTALMLVIAVYALILFVLVKITLRALKC